MPESSLPQQEHLAMGEWRALCGAFVPVLGRGVPLAAVSGPPCLVCFKTEAAQ